MNLTNIQLPIRLSNQQIRCVDGLINSINRYGIGVLTAETGVGKTVMSFSIFRALEYQNKDKPLIMLVVAPANICPTFETNSISPWDRESKVFNVPHDVMRTVSYETIRGTRITETNINTKITVSKILKKDVFKNPPNASSTGYFDDLDSTYENFNWSNEYNENTLYGINEKYIDYDVIKNNDDDYDKLINNYTVLKGLVVRKDYIITKTDKFGISKEVEKSVFSPSLDFMKFCVENNVLIVMDEVDNSKGDSAQGNASAALVRAVRRAREVDPSSKSGLLILTATPAEKELHVMNYLRLIGSCKPIQEDDMVISRWTSYKSYLVARCFNPRLALEMAQHANIIDSWGNEIIKKGNDGVSKGKDEKKIASSNLYFKCVSVIVQYAAYNPYPKQTWNAFLDVTSAEGLQAMTEVGDLLKKLASLRKKDESLRMSILGALAVQLELSVADAIVDEAIFRLNDNKNDKVLIGFQHVDNVRNAEKRINEAMGWKLNEYVGRISGKNLVTIEKDYNNLYKEYVKNYDEEKAKDMAVKKSNENQKASMNKKNSREKIIGKSIRDLAIKYIDPSDPFAKESDEGLKKRFIKVAESFQNGKFRAIVATRKMIARGKDLHDTNGNQRRWSYMPGDYWLSILMQFAGRTARVGSKTIPQIFMCYPKILGPGVISVYEGLAKKSNMMKKFLTTVNSTGMTDNDTIELNNLMKLPSSYDTYIQLPDRNSIFCFSLTKPIWIRNKRVYVPDPETVPIKEFSIAEKITTISDAYKNNVNADKMDGYFFFGPVY